jgi:hypothetical protein
MFIKVRFPKLKKSYKETARSNEQKLIKQMEKLVVAEESKTANHVFRGGRLSSKKVKTFKL